MTHQLRALRGHLRWQAAAFAALFTAAVTVAGALAATSSPALADGAGGAATTTTTPTTDAPAATTTSSVPADPSGYNGRLAWAQANAAHLIANRVASLDAAIKLVESLSFLGSDGTTLVDNMQGDISGLQSLGAQVAGDTSLGQVLKDRALIFSEFRVYLLVLPVARDVVATDRITAVLLPAVQDAITKLQGLETSGNQEFLGPLVAGMETQVGIGSSATSGLSAQLLSYTATEWDANHRLLFSAESDLRSANRALEVASRDLKLAERYLLSGGKGRHRGHGGGAVNHGHGQGNGWGTTTSTTTTTPAGGPGSATTSTTATSTSTTTSTSTSTTATTAPAQGS